MNKQDPTKGTTMTAAAQTENRLHIPSWTLGDRLRKARLDAGIRKHLKERNLRPGTIYQRERVYRRLTRHLAPKQPILATSDDLRDYLAQSDMAASARATEVSHLRGLYSWAYKEGWINEDPSRVLIRPKIPRRLPRPMPDQDVRRAIQEAPWPTLGMLALAAYSGLRACEIAQLSWEDIDKANGCIRVVVSKGGGESVVPLSPQLARVLEPRRESGLIFTQNDGSPLKPHNVSARCNRYLHGLDISHTLHTLRHWFGTWAYRGSGRDLRTTQELLRHSSVVSTQLYTWVEPEAGRAAVSAIPEIM